MQALQKKQRTNESETETKASSSKKGSKASIDAKGRRKGKPGTRFADKTKQVNVAPLPVKDPNDFSASKENLSPDDQERFQIIEQMQQQIVRKGNETTGRNDDEIEHMLHGYTSCCHNAAMELVKNQAIRAAGRILRQCEDFFENKVPTYIKNLVQRKGIMHTVMNNLAQHANMVADMQLSIQYLEKALKHAEHPETEQDLLPLAETYLNLANGYSFLNKYQLALEYSEKALKFAKLRCNKLRQEIQNEHSKPNMEQNHKVQENLSFQLNDFIAIMVMSHLAVGEQHEKLGSFNAAIKFYSEGKQFAETNFGTKHPLYTKCINSMGGARLKSKYQTKEVFRNTESHSKVANSKKKGVKKHSSEDSTELLNPITIKSKLMAKRLQDGPHLKSSRRDIQGLLKAEARMSSLMKNKRDNLLLANCDSWTSMHCRHPRPSSKKSLIVSMQTRRSSRARPSSARNEVRLSREQRMSHQILDSLTDRKGPYKIVCKIGPNCKNHDWTIRSPLKKVCTRGPNCPNHDWDCSKRSSSISINTHRSLTKIEKASSPPTQAHPPAETQSVNDPKEERSVMENSETKSAGGHSCMLQQTELIHHQQMQHMRSMQEDQFKMLQLVIESQQSQQSRQSVQSLSMPQQFIYNPYMNPYAQGYVHPPYYGQPGAGYMQYPPNQFYPHHQGADDYDTSQTETDMSETEQIKDGRKPKQEDQYKAEALQQAFHQQQQEMQELNHRMSLMHQQYTQQINDMRAQQEAALKKQVTKKSSTPSISEKKPFSQKDYKEDSDVNDRDEVVFKENASTTGKKRKVSDERILANDVALLARDVSKRTIGEKSILKQSTIKSKVGYHSSIIEDSAIKKKDVSQYSRSPSRDDQASSRGEHSRQRSFAQSSVFTEKSFRIPHSQAYTKNEAAIKIQKIYRGFRDKQDFKLVYKGGIQKKFLFKATIRGEQAQILTCSLNIRQGQVMNLVFGISDRKKSHESEKIEIDLRGHAISDITSMKDKVLRIIRDALTAEDLKGAIQVVFKSNLAKEILQAEVFTSDDYEGVEAIVYGKSTSEDLESARHLSEEQEEQVAHKTTSYTKKEGQQTKTYEVQAQEIFVPQTASERSRLIAAEIERVRKNCEVNYRVEVDNVVIKGHRRKFDDEEGEKIIDAELHKHVAVDREDEKNLRKIKIGTIGIRRHTNRSLNEHKDDDHSEDSQHDYEFILGNAQPVVIQQISLSKLVKVQALVKGFLTRRGLGSHKKVLYNRILRRENCIVKFMLVKNGKNSYTLSANVQMIRNLHVSQSKNLVKLPFHDDEASELFEEHLVFKYEHEKITELDLKGTLKKANPFIEVVGTLFITDFKPTDKKGEFLIIRWKLRETYPCEFFQVNEGGEKYFKVVVEHMGKNDYIKLNKLPVEMFYMAEYLDEAVQVSKSDQNTLNYIYITAFAGAERFIKQMREKEIKFFGCPWSEIENNRKIDHSRKAPIDDSKSQASICRDFEIARSGVKYIVEVFEESAQKGHFNIVVKQKIKPNDKDYMQLTQINLGLDDLIEYLKQNLRVYTKASGNIDYLTLSNDNQSKNNMTNSSLHDKKESNRESAHKSARPLRPSSGKAKDEKGQGKKIKKGNSNADMATIGILALAVIEAKLTRDTELFGKMDPYCKISTSQQKFKTAVKNGAGKTPVFNETFQINVKSIGDDMQIKVFDKDTVNDDLIGETLIKLDALCVTDGIDNWFQIQSKAKVVGQVHLKSVWHPTSDAAHPADSAVAPQFSQAHDKDQNWKELTREKMNTQYQALLMAQVSINNQQKGTSQTQNDADSYRIVVLNSLTQENTEQLNLSPYECSRLLKIQPTILQNNEQLMTLQQILDQGARQSPNAAQSKKHKQESTFDENETLWREVLRNVTFSEVDRQLKFNVARICESKGAKIGNIPVKFPKMNLKKQPSPVETQNSQEERKNVDHNVDGGEDGSLEDSLNSARRMPAPTFDIVRKKSPSKKELQQRFEEPLSPIQRESGDGLSKKNMTKALVKSQDGKYYQMQILQSGNDYQLTLQERDSKKFVCRNEAIPREFLDEIKKYVEEDDALATIQLNLKAKIQNASNLKTTDGKLNRIIFQI